MYSVYPYFSPVAYHQLLIISIVTRIIMCSPMLGVWRLSGLVTPAFPSSLVNYHVLQAQILGESAGLLQGSRNSVVRASTAKVGGLGFDSQWLPMHFSLQFVSILIYHMILIISIVTKIIKYTYVHMHAKLKHMHGV